MVILTELPEGIIVKILLKLPVKSLMRCRCVSKTCYVLGGEPSFVHSHLKEQSQDEKRYFISRHHLITGTEQEYYYIRCDETFLQIGKLGFPFRRSTRNFSLVGSSNGLLFVLDPRNSRSDRNMFLWNPFIRMIKRLPRSPATYQRSIDRFVFGFVFLPEINDYKVVRVIFYEPSCSKNPIRDPPVTEIYSLNSDSWERIETVVPCFTARPVPVVFLNGFFYWVATLDGNDSIDYIVSFDMKSKTFQVETLPVGCLTDGRLVGSLTAFRGSLFMFARRGDLDWSMWLMKENGSGKYWSEICFLDDQDIGAMPLGFNKNGQILTETLDGTISLHDPHLLRSPKKYLTTLNEPIYFKFSISPFVTDAFEYSPSLALLDRRTGVVRQ